MGCGASRVIPDDDEPVNKKQFEIERIIGQGGFGKVSPRRDSLRSGKGASEEMRNASKKKRALTYAAERDRRSRMQLVSGRNREGSAAGALKSCGGGAAADRLPRLSQDAGPRRAMLTPIPSC
jgi:hypothetical protein